jgi:hypothetical protein
MFLLEIFSTDEQPRAFLAPKSILHGAIAGSVTFPGENCQDRSGGTSGLANAGHHANGSANGA